MNVILPASPAMTATAAPTLILDGERFRGQDRLDFVDSALAMRAARG
jgi:2-hydroxychromene-2-carboxylate isomerase